ALNTNYGAVQWGVHQYNPNFMTSAELAQWNRDTMLDARLLATGDATGPHLTVATVSPGYNDRRLRGNANPIVERGSAGERYLASWDAAVAGDPDWILVTSWNEWYEGTHIEPSVLYGDLALRQTAERTALFSP
ncbi:MAG: glycoside hydrolase family 99-like domain-containing protein, partial [Actinomycetota bacterium]